ncbi:MAG: transketolase [Candidatus Tectomicrobia bacterium]|uniref:Transketolase n=1 Tax=Tectimicrobiota bacterium TaxID=2528274 RepID=A0A932FYE1_UNCTE|nr:transketolase [Candidatus Tectomicrobia bacterium]
MEDRIAELKEIARQVRIDILQMLAKAGSGHTGGSLSAVEIVTSLYFARMRHNPERPDWEDRDRFVLSKGHGAPVLYAVLSRCGYFDRKHLETLRQLGSILQGHPYSGATPGIEASTGSLGQGLSQANGMALAARLSRKDWRVYALLGDGESQEGLIWEAAMTAAHYKLDNLCAITDNNGLQIDGPVSRVMAVEPIARKWEAFGWHVVEVDGHRFEEILAALDSAERTKGRPTMIVARTVKGKGVSFMENQVKYHGVTPTPQELELALKELQAIE